MLGSEGIDTGYTTEFYGHWTVTPPLRPEHIAYINAFNETRRMDRSDGIASLLPDPVREAVGLPIGKGGGYFVGGKGFAGQDRDASILNYNSPPPDQPGLWCQWRASDDGKRIEWDEGEKFYEYTDWLEYLIEHFLGPWGYRLDGQVDWSGEEPGDTGSIRVDGTTVSVNSLKTYEYKGNVNMATPKATTKTPAATLGVTTQPARAAARAAKPAPAGTTSKAASFQAWKDAISTAQQAVGYTTSSPIHGLTDLEVLKSLRDGLEALKNGTATGTMLDDSLLVIDELMKRKVARVAAGQTYRSRK